MQVNPYLFYDGNCEEALKFYQKVLGARIEAMHRFGEGPPEMQSAPEHKDRIMHARVTIDGEVLMASDGMPGHFNKPQGFAVSLWLRRLKVDVQALAYEIRNRFRISLETTKGIYDFPRASTEIDAFGFVGKDRLEGISHRLRIHRNQNAAVVEYF